jgi:RimJ/RimL family protein N-acetyltransferase
VLERLLGDPAMTVHIGGPETPEQLRARHERYLRARDAEPGGLFAVTLEGRQDAVGWVGYWETAWQGRQVWEAGWSVLPAFQGRGVASAATTLMLAHASAAGPGRCMHAFPSVDNAASNAICRKAGFVLQGPVEIEYPPGRLMCANDWCCDLRKQQECEA